MDPHCHRCGTVLTSPEIFCANCGAPQLRLEDGADDSRQGAAERRSQSADLRGVAWRSAVGAAVSVAVPVGILSSQAFPWLSGACCLWGVGGSIAAVALYQRRSTPGFLDASIGMRIGLIVGLIASVCSSAATGGWLLVQRFAMHGGAAMDKNWQTQLEQNFQATAQLFPSVPQQVSQAQMRFLLTPDGKAAAVLLNAVFFSAGMLVFSAIGGALGARIFTNRRGALKNP